MIELEHLTKTYPDGTTAVDDVSLRIEDQELVALVGPSGSGKSTILKAVAGLTPVSSGTIRIAGADVTGAAPQDRDIAMVFQSYALYPRMSVRKNLDFGLRMRKVPKQERAARVTEVARMLSIEQLLDRRPGELSGGERQRVAMGRAMVRQPAAFLLDEPLSNLDAKLRVQVRTELIQLRKRLPVTSLYVTHDQVEAMTLGNRVAVLDHGVLQQVDSPRALYDAPRNVFVGTFIGSPQMNVFRRPRETGGISLGDGVFAPPGESSSEVLLGIRPGALELDHRCPDSSWPRLEAICRAVEDLGSERIVLFELPESGPSSQATLYQAIVDPEAAVPVDGLVRLGVDPMAVHCFDAASGESLGRLTQMS